MDLLVSEQYLKATLPLSENTDYKLLKLHAEEAQLKFILPLLGTEYYDDLITRFVSQNLTQIEINELVPALKRIVAYKAFARIVITINVNIANNGVSNRIGQYFDSTDKQSEIRQLQSEYNSDADFWTTYSLNILCKYPNSFPLYKQTPTNLVNPQENTQMSGGWNVILF